MPGSDDDRLVERLTGASATELETPAATGSASKEELRQRLRIKQDRSKEEEEVQKEDEENDRLEWDVVRGLHYAAMLLSKVCRCCAPMLSSYMPWKPEADTQTAYSVTTLVQARVL